MKCPYCNESNKFTTVDSRPREWGIKRRKRCLKCNRIFATIEIYNISEEALSSLELSQWLIDQRQKERIEE